MDSKEIGMEALTSIDNFWTTIVTWSLVIIGDEGVGDIGFAREPNGGVEKGVDNFSAMGEGGGVYLRDKSMIMFFLLSFLEILGC